MDYTRKYFINFFKKLCDNEIGSGSLAAHCANWHLGVKEGNHGDYEYPNHDVKEQVLSLSKYFGFEYKDFQDAVRSIYWVNDGYEDYKLLGKTPKQRILAALETTL